MRIACLVFALLATACGGSRFDGHWVGPFTSTMIDGSLQTGTLDVKIAGGELDGFGLNDQLNQRFNVVGRINAKGGTSATYTFPRNEVYTVSGTMDVVSSHLTGDFDVWLGGARAGGASIDLTTAR